MATFLFAFRTTGRSLADLDPADLEQRRAAWTAWQQQLGEHVRDGGSPVVEARTLGNTGPGTRVGGYSLIEAVDLDAAVALAEGCPALEFGGGVEVGVLAGMTASVPAAAR